MRDFWGQLTRVRPADRGNITILTIGLVALTLTLVLLATTAAAVHLERKRLWNLADTVALEVADTAALRSHYEQEVSREFIRDEIKSRISSPRGDQEVFEQLSVGGNSAAPNTEYVLVHLRAISQPGPMPWVLIPWASGITIEAEATANILD